MTNVIFSLRRQFLARKMVHILSICVTLAMMLSFAHAVMPQEQVAGSIVDLHTHSSYSDGADDAIELVVKAKENGISLLVFTEHDQVTVPKEAIEEGERLGVEVLVGTEISCEWMFTATASRASSKAHMLGYFFDPNDKDLKKALTDVQIRRASRNEQIIEILQSKFGIQITMAEVQAQVSLDTKSIGRVHIARALVAKNHAADVSDAFSQYLDDDKLELPQWSMTCAEAVDRLSMAGGMAVLAHPVTLALSDTEFESELAAFVASNPLSGLEVYSSRHSAAQVEVYKGIATRLGLRITGGSDYHGVFKPNVKLGEFGGGNYEFRQDGWQYFNAMLESLKDLFVVVAQRKLSNGLSALFWQIMSYASLGAIFFFCKRQVEAAFAAKHSSPMSQYVQNSKFLRWFCLDTPVEEKSSSAEQKPLVGAIDEDDDELAEAGLQDLERNKPIDPPPKPEQKKFNIAKLVMCVLGLQCSYLTWGFFQERIMTVNYGDDDSTARFTNSEFLVFINRFWALVLSTAIIKYKRVHEAVHCPVFKYSFSSMSNIMSSWFQYEVLKFISFPLQGLAKSTKVIVTMLMGKLVSNKHFPISSYVNASLITVGLIIFRYGGNGDNNDAFQPETEEGKAAASNLFILGMVMILGYVLCDSFTSTWQGKLFTQYKMSSWTMMQGINLCSVVIGLSMLLAHDALFPSLAFLMQYPLFAMHAMIMSTCSASGQMFIFVTIADFGPVVLATVMTFRQVISILLSMYMFGHPINFLGVVGMGFVFFALFYKLYESWRRSRS